MTGVQIERLTLDVPGLDAEQGRRLGEMVAQRLSEARWVPARSAGAIGIDVAHGGGSLDQLASAIAAELQRRLA